MEMSLSNEKKEGEKRFFSLSLKGAKQRGSVKTNSVSLYTYFRYKCRSQVAGTLLLWTGVSLHWAGCHLWALKTAGACTVLVILVVSAECVVCEGHVIAYSVMTS